MRPSFSPNLFLSPDFLDFFWIVRLPLSFAWWGFTFVKRQFYPRRWRRRFPLKVISVGNLHSGGSGKTPLVLELAQALTALAPAIVTRGYLGESSAKPTQVDCGSARGVSLYGDEAWMMAHRVNTPVWVGKNRTQNLTSIYQKQQNACVILDDGFQHFPLARDLDLVCINTSRSPEESDCLPLGDLREPWGAAKRADAIVLVTGEAAEAEVWKAFLASFCASVPCFVAVRRYEICGSQLPPNQKWGAFCGVGHSSAFESALTAWPQAIFLRAFPNHHGYSSSDVDFLISKKKSLGLGAFVTTDKDFYKVSALFSGRREALASLRIRYELPEQFWYFLNTRLEL